MFLTKDENQSIKINTDISYISVSKVEEKLFNGNILLIHLLYDIYFIKAKEQAANKEAIILIHLTVKTM